MTLSERRRRNEGVALWGNSLAPLIDVLFLLLIFVLVAANFDQRVIVEVDLPTAQTATPLGAMTPEQERVITVFSDGSLFFNGSALTLEELAADLGARGPEERLLSIVIRGDESAPLGLGIRILDTLRGLGYQGCSFEVLKK